MRRADRLMALIQHLRDGALHKAADLAAATDVSLRTIYRDMDTLAASGVPIEGERGIGYRVTAAITLPPLNLTMTEVEALHIGLLAVGIVRRAAGAERLAEMGGADALRGVHRDEVDADNFGSLCTCLQQADVCISLVTQHFGLCEVTDPCLAP